MSTYLGQDTFKLGFGLMRLPKNKDGSIDIPQVSQMADAFIAAGGHLLREEVRAEGLLQHRIPHVFLIRKDALNRGLAPDLPPHRRRYASGGQGLGDLMDGVSFKESPVYGLYDLRLPRNDLRRVILAPAIAQEGFVVHGHQ